MLVKTYEQGIVIKGKIPGFRAPGASAKSQQELGEDPV